MFKNKIRSLGVAIGFVATIGMAMGTSGVAFAANTPGLSNDTSASLALSAGALSVQTPDVLDFPATSLTGDATTSASPAASFPILVSDATGAGAGWAVSLSATTFTGTGLTPPTLANSGTLKVPTAITATHTTGTAPTGNTVTYPVAITTAATAPTASPIYIAPAGTGLGDSELDTPLTLVIPANTLADTYSSTITVTVATLP